jgi:hypothetical protein
MSFSEAVHLPGEAVNLLGAAVYLPAEAVDLPAEADYFLIVRLVKLTIFLSSDW